MTSARASGTSRPASARTSTLDLEGAVSVADWWPDGSALLLVNRSKGAATSTATTLATGDARRRSPTEPGLRLEGARSAGRAASGSSTSRATGSGSSSTTPAPRSSRSASAAPASRPYESWHFENEHGQRVHGFVVTPDDSGGPFPVMMFVHGGPTWLDLDRWQPEVQAYVDAGFVVGMVNYRGSIGYGREWRDTLDREHRRAGARGRQRGPCAISSRAASPIPSARSIAGYSWGGYVTLLELGKHPELWRCGDRRCAGRRLRGRVRGALTAPPGVRPRAPRRARRRRRCRSSCATATRSTSPTRCARPSSSSSGETTAAARTARRWRTSTSSRRASTRTRSTCSRRATARSTSTSASAQVGTILDFLARHVPGVRVTGLRR